MAWWDRHPGELRREIHALEAAGMQPQKNEEWFSKGKAIIHIRIEVLGKGRDAIISYPDLYPYFRPVLYVPGLDANLRHYNPCIGEICLLKRGTQYWLPNTTAAEHIQDMLPRWEKAAVRAYDESRLEIEDSQAEPVTVYYSAKETQRIAMDSSWQLPSGSRSGHIEIALPAGYKSIVPSGSDTAWVTGIEEDGKKNIKGISLAEPLEKWIKTQGYEKCKFSWVRLDAPPFGRNESELAQILISSSPQINSHIKREISLCKSGLYGFCFPEEAPDGGKRDGWLFVAYHYDHKMKRMGRNPDIWIIKPDYAGEKDLFERIPELHPLRGKTIAVIGLGCVGAPSALALARAGIGELRFLDGDIVSAGTTCRWPLGLTAVGKEKVNKLAEFVSLNYPFTRIGTAHYPHGKKGCMVNIGAAGTDYDQWDCLDKLIEGIDLIYDATAEQGINLMLNDLAIARKIPYITVSSRAGGWGGNVVRVRPGRSEGCYLCYLHALQDKQIPQPPYDPRGDSVQPIGCGNITFQAASFDVEEIALSGVRMAVSTLCEGFTGTAYPPTVNDVAILSLRKDGTAVFPEWQSSPLQKHPQCGRCNQ